MRTVWILGLCLFYAALNVTGTALIKRSIADNALENARDYLVFLLQFPVVLGIALNFLSMLVVVKALAMAKFIYVFPVAIGINFAMTAIAGYYIFSERMSLMSFAGLALILGGILVMSAANQ